MKTLDEVEARTIVNAANTPGDAVNSFIIAVPGSYYLTGNLAGTPGKNGISIRANDVALDLNGFALIGGGVAGSGIHVPAAQSGLAVSNGSVRGWAGGGMQAGAACAVVERLRLSENVGAVGLTVGNGSLVTQCVAEGNNIGFQLKDRTQITNCISTVNTAAGFVCAGFVSVVDCTASRNAAAGFTTEAGCSLIRCTATRNLPKFAVGIQTGDGCTVLDCTVDNNGGDGITLGAGSTVRGCTVSGNGFRGILAKGGSCYLSGNNCHRNGFNGIEINDKDGRGSRVEGNNCSWNQGIGFLIQDGFNNLLVRNSAHQNHEGNYSVPGAAAGQIVQLGNLATIANVSPWANFSA